MEAIRLLLLIFGILAVWPACAGPTLVINSSYLAPLTSPAHDGVMDRFYAELGRRTGIDFVIQLLPAERCLLNADAGIDDGDVGRIAGLDARYPNLVRVAEPVMSFQLSAFSRSARFRVDGPDSFQGHMVGIVTGWKILEQKTSGLASVVKLESQEQLFSMLDKDRIDVALIEKSMGLYAIKSMKLNGIAVLHPALVEGEWFLYLNKKHQALLPELNAAIRQMKKDGSYQRIFASALKAYAQ